MLRTFVRMGAPIQAKDVFFQNANDDTDQQNVYVLSFHQEVMNYVDQYNEILYTNGNKMKVYMYSDQITYKDVSDQSFYDRFWVGGSLLFMLLMMAFHLRSLVVTLYCFLLTLICVVVNHAIYTSMFGEIFTNDHTPAVIVLF